jgi:polar amino acid transport system substrate-binding protein
MNAVWLQTLLAISVLTAAQCASAQSTDQASKTIEAVTEENSNLHRIGPDGSVVGPGADLVREVLRRARVPYVMSVYPWPRAYAMAQHEPNVLIFSMARTTDREDKFKWVGEVISADYRLVRLKTRPDIKVDNLDDAKHYSIGVVNQDVAHHFLLEHGFPVSGLDVASDFEINVGKLLAGRTDLVVASESNPGTFCPRDPRICDRVETAYVIKEMRSSLFMAFSLQTPDSIVSDVRMAYEQMRADGTWSRIMAGVR